MRLAKYYPVGKITSIRLITTTCYSGSRPVTTEGFINFIKATGHYSEREQVFEALHPGLN